LVLRRSLKETEEFQNQKHHPSGREVMRIIGANWQVVVRGMFLTALTTTTFYLITAYTPTFGKQVLGFADRDNLIITLCVGFSNLFWLPVGGALSDRIGRRPMLLALTTAAILTAYPAMSWLISAPSFGRLLAVELWFSFIFGIYNGAMIPFLTEIMPPLVRTSGFSLAYSCATALFGGMTPLISTWLIQQTGNRAIPGAWLTIPAILALGAALLSRPYSEPAAVRAHAAE
jgi:MFS transporter, MHS family, citrate/tricarballylate:H+ symporter